MDSTHENTAQDYPYICCRAISRTCDGTEDGSESGNIKELDDEHLPCRHWSIIDSVSHFVSRSLSGRIHIKILGNEPAIYEIGRYKQQDSNNESNHVGQFF